MPGKRHYTLTFTAENDLIEARRWSNNRWGNDLTQQYFQELHETANNIALNQESVAERDDLTGESGLCIHPVREHYLIYLPVTPKHIIIVSVQRQTRDIPALLKRSAFILNREIGAIKLAIENGQISIR